MGLLKKWLNVFFTRDGRIAWGVLAAFVAINLIVCVNAIQHDPRVGYDASGHLKYARVLAEGRWPTHHDTHEFFCPPLPYVPTAAAIHVMDVGAAYKVGQAVQVLASFVLTFFLLKTARLLQLSTAGAGFVLLLLGLLPVYYKTFAMVRGEPFLATCLVVGTYLTLCTFVARRPTMAMGVMIGVTLGLAVLSRQWAFFALPALGLVGLWRLIVDPANRIATIRSGLALLIAFALVGLPFYAKLQVEYGSVRAFNRDPKSAGEPTMSSQTLPMTDALKTLATRPIRDAFKGHPFLLYYADVWGDYWQYFLVIGKDPKGRSLAGPDQFKADRAGRLNRTNIDTMPAYMGRVAVVGIVPSAWIAAGLVLGVIAIRRTPCRVALPEAETLPRVGIPTMALVVLGTAAGYAWFVLSYPNDNGDTIKASYPLQVYAPLAVLGGVLAERLGGRGRRVLGVLLVGVWLHALPACFTRAD